jgi:endonuclease YncB( thermonuclease family)
MIRSFQIILALLLAGVIAATANKGSRTPGTRGAAMVADGMAAGQATNFLQRVTASKPSLETAMARRAGSGEVDAPLVKDGQLERIAALPQPTPPTAPKADMPTAPDARFLRWRLVFNAVATSAGILQAGETALVLPGIDAVSVDEACTTPSGASWPCGMVARTAFRNYLQGRALNCRLPDTAPEKAIVAECLLLGQDPAAWLVEQGWARITPDSPLADLAETAKTLNRGIYGQPPAGVEIKSP